MGTLGATYSPEYVNTVNTVVIPSHSRKSFKKMLNRYLLLLGALIVAMVLCMCTLIFVNTSNIINTFLWLGIASVTFFIGCVMVQYEYVPKLKFHDLYKKEIKLDTIKEQWLDHDIHDEDD
jgi:hypothetical protein